MSDLALVLIVLLACAVWVFGRRRLAHASRLEAIAFLITWCFALGLALRFGARTYPGVHVPNTPLLNDIFNSGFLFVDLGYGAVAVCFVTRLALLTLPLGRWTAAVLRMMAWFGVAIALLIASYGFFYAAKFNRLNLILPP